MQKICDSPFVICVSENYIFVVLLGEDVYHTGGRLMDDSKIIELYNARNEQAIRVTEEKYGKYCFVIAKNILSIEQDCEECVNDTWLRAWNSIPPSKPNSLKLFLAKITRNLAIDRVKRANHMNIKRYIISGYLKVGQTVSIRHGFLLKNNYTEINNATDLNECVVTSGGQVLIPE